MCCRKKSNAIIRATIFIGTVFVLLSCLGERADESGATDEGIKAVVKANNQFAFEFYRKLAGEKERENIFFSPYSISTAYAMLYEGARGGTAEEIRSVFGFPEDDNLRRPAVGAIYNRLNPRNQVYELETANALWIKEEIEVLPKYIDVVEKFYLGLTKYIDFESDPEKARKTINEWVEEQTKGLIEGLFDEDMIHDGVAFVLTNAIYFKGYWGNEFDEDHTEDEMFRIADEESVEVPMMRTDEEEEYGYYEDKDVQVLELPYKGDRLSMVVILPKDEDLVSLEETITHEAFENWREEIRVQNVHVYLPRFELTTKYTEMDDYLSEMGMPSAFLSHANFAGISKADLYIGATVHGASILVEEAGTKAAAATGIRLESMFPVFRADHPFLFFIKEKETGHLLFLGRVLDPS